MELIDRIRQDNETIVVELVQAERVADASSAIALRQILLFGLVGACVLVVVVRTVTRSATRLREDLRAQQLRYESEKRVADALQQAFLQRSLRQSFRGSEMHAVYMPAEQEARASAATGKMRSSCRRARCSSASVTLVACGIEAAVSMSRARQTLLSLATLPDPDPATILEHVNRTLLLQGQTMVTALCCFIDPHTFEMRYASAGHPPPVIVEPGREPRLVTGNGVPLGIINDATYSSHTLAPAAGSFLVLYTDGVTEYARDIAAGEAALLRAAKRVARASRKDPALALRDAVFRRAKPFDDVAILTLRFLSPAAEKTNNHANTSQAARTRSMPRRAFRVAKRP